jgi:ribonuclease HI
MITIYTDGASKGNPGPGGFGAVLLYKDRKKELSGGYRKTTNNRMELFAVIRALEALKRTGLDITIYSDSKYVVEAIEKGWVFKWEKKGFANKKNPDLWERLLKLYRQHTISFQWVKGHANNHYNERCDQLAVNAAEQPDLKVDQVYEQSG